MHLYDAMLSGNCYKVRLLLAQLGLSCRRTEVDVMSAAARPPELLAGNPHGKVPLLELEDGRCLAESNAILWFLADGTSLLPEDPFERAQILRWMFFEQNGHEPNIAVARYLMSLLGAAGEHPEVLADKRRRGHDALEAMERHLRRHDFFVGDRYSIADIALYAYTHVAPEGGFALEPYPAVLRWLERVRQQPGHVPMAGAGAEGES
jgi:glutathione S-transferase